MIYFNIIFGVLGVMCAVFVIFNIMDFLSWWFVKGKNVVVGIYNLLKGFIPK